MPQTNPQAATDLLAEFSPVSYENWRKLVEAELKGAPFEKKMLTQTYEGIVLRPLYCRQDIEHLPHVNSFPGFAPFVRGATAGGYLHEPWDVSQEIISSSPSEFNHAARNSVTRGSNALNMVLDKATRDGHDPDWARPEEVGHGGLSIATLGDLDRALEGIDLEHVRLFIRTGASGLPVAALLAALAVKRKKDFLALQGCIEMDPLGVLSHQGRLPQSLPGAYREMAALTAWAVQHAPQLQTICVHSRSWHESGGHAIQELAFTLATAVEYLRRMNQARPARGRGRAAHSVRGDGGRQFLHGDCQTARVANVVVPGGCRAGRQRVLAAALVACPHLAVEQDGLRSAQ